MLRTMGSRHCNRDGTAIHDTLVRLIVHLSLSFYLILSSVSAGRVVDTDIAMNGKCCGIPKRSEDLQTSTNCMNYFETEQNKFQHSEEPKKLFIGGLFPLSGTSLEVEASGKIDQQVACLALERINSMQFIPDYDLVMYYNDTQVSGHYRIQ